MNQSQQSLPERIGVVRHFYKIKSLKHLDNGLARHFYQRKSQEHLDDCVKVFLFLFNCYYLKKRGISMKQKQRVPVLQPVPWQVIASP